MYERCNKSEFEKKQLKLTAIFGNKAKRKFKYSYRLINNLTDSTYHSPVKNVFKTISQRKKTRKKSAFGRGQSEEKRREIGTSMGGVHAKFFAYHVY